MSPDRNFFGKGLDSIWRTLAKFISVQPDRVPTTGREPRQYKMPVLLVLCKRAQKGLVLHQGHSNCFHLRRYSLSVVLLLHCLSFFLPSSPYTLLWDLASSHCLTGVTMYTWHQAEAPKVAARQQGGCWIRHLLARWICRREESNWMVQELAPSLSHSEVDLP